MANFVYLLYDEATKQGVVVDACWDGAGLKTFADGIGVTITGALYTHKHFDHGGGNVPPKFTGGMPVR